MSYKRIFHELQPGQYKCYYKDKECQILHRENGPAVEFIDGHKEWWVDGILHREDGPAIEFANGDKEWVINGVNHRKDGPAVEYANGNKFWILNGEECSELEYWGKIKFGGFV